MYLLVTYCRLDAGSLLTLWSKDLHELGEIELENEMTDMVIFDQELFVMTPTKMRVIKINFNNFDSKSNCLSLKQAIPMKFKHSKIAFFEGKWHKGSI